MRRIGQSLAILAFVLTLSGNAVQAGLVWLDPNNFSEGQQITVPFVTLSAVKEVPLNFDPTVGCLRFPIVTIRRSVSLAGTLPAQPRMASRFRGGQNGRISRLSLKARCLMSV